VAWEYVLITGVISVAIVAAAASTDFTTPIVNGICSAVDAVVTAFDIAGC